MEKVKEVGNAQREAKDHGENSQPATSKMHISFRYIAYLVVLSSIRGGTIATNSSEGLASASA